VGNLKFKHILKMRQVFIVWLLSYIIVLLVSVSISFGIYIETVRIIEQEISRANLSMLEQVKQALDSRLKDVDRLAMQIAFNSRILTAIRVYGYFRPQDRFNLYKAIEELRHYKASSGFVTDLYVYLHGTDTVITPNTHSSSRLFFDFTYGGTKISHEEWKNIMLTSHRNNYLVVGEEESEFHPLSSIINVQSIPIDSIRNPQGTIVISINEAKIRDVIKSIGWIDQGSVFIINNRNEIIATSNKGEIPGFLEHYKHHFLDGTAGYNGIKYQNLDGEKTVVAFSSSQIADWKYISVVPYSVFWEKARYIRYLAWLGMLLTLLIGGLGSYLLARKNYSPIDKIVKSITGKTQKNEQRTSNEYQFIQENISIMIDENNKITKMLEEQNRTLKDNFLLRLLKGKLEDNVVTTQAFSSLGIDFHTNHFVVMLFSIDSTDPIVNENKNLSISNYNHARFVVAGVLEELINKKHQSIMLQEEKEMFVCIINFKNAGIDVNLSEIDDIIKEVREFIKTNFSFRVTTAISDIHKGPYGLSQAYQEALEAMEYKIVAGTDELIRYKNIKKSKCADYHFSIEMEQKLINCIKIGDFEKATTVLRDIFKDNFSREAFSAEISRCLMFDLVSTIMKTAEDMKDASFLEELQPVRQILDCKTVMEMKYRIADILNKVCEYVELNKIVKNNPIGDRVKDFVARNYADVNLGVSMIGDSFGLTPSYISRLFKEQVKESLPEYINRVRIEKAIELLMDKENSIFNVAQKAGYSNSNVFIRAFKKYQGITPGKFKEMKVIS